MKFWFNTIIPWDQNDPATTTKPRDAQIVATRPKFMIVHLGNEWIDIDIIWLMPRIHEKPSTKKEPKK